MPSVSSSSLVAGTSSSDLTPQETIDGARARELAEVGGDVGRTRELAMHAAEAAGRHDLDAERAHGGERAADGRRAERALHATGREVARADLAAAEPHRRSAAARPRVSPTTSSPSRMPTVAGTAPAARTAASDDAPTAISLPCGKPWATSVVSRHTTGARRASASATSGEMRSGRSRQRPDARDAAGRGGLAALDARRRDRARAGSPRRMRRPRPSCR